MYRSHLGFAACLGLTACSPEPSPTRPDVLLICLDTVCADHLGSYGYSKRPTSPNLDALARDSVQFMDASAVACWTKPSVPSFLTGTWPLEHGVYEGSARLQEGETTDLLPEKAETMAEAFSAAGYDTAAFVHNAQLRRGNGFEQGFATFEEGNFDAREIRWLAKDWLDERAAGKPYFLYLHFLDAHFPCPVPDEYAGKFADGADLSIFRGDGWKNLRDDVNDGRRTLSSSEREALVALYDGAIRYVDDEIGRLFEALKRQGISRNLVVCVVADHGEEFLEHGRIGHGHGLYENLLRVPWILHVPGRPAERVEQPVTLVDLLPTLLGAAGIRAPAGVSGLDRLSGRDPVTPIFAEHKEPGSYSQSLREADWKLVRRFRRGAPISATEGASIDLPAVGSRWEVELDPATEGPPRARKASPRAEPPSDPVEIKGIVQRREESRLRVCGIDIRFDSATGLSGEVPVRDGKKLSWKDGVAPAGTLVKAVGHFAEGSFVAERIKLYGADEDVEHLIRGPIGAAEGRRDAGRLRIGQCSIEWDSSTRWSGESPSERATLSREDVAQIAEIGAAAAEGASFLVETRLFDLRVDPGEQRPVEDPSRVERMGATLDRLAEGLVGRRIWSESDRAILEPKTIDALRKLGYVR
ncbi:MAG: sulfatase [Planctomycetota bacterium]